MDENGSTKGPAPRTWLKRTGIGFGILVLLLLVFHRPILLAVGRAVAIRFAAKENLKLDCRLEGSIFTNLVIRNLRVVATGPSAVESIDADYIRADYSPLAFWREGASELLDNVEVRTVTAVINPAKASLKPKVPEPDKPMTLPTIFPKKVQIADVNVRVRSTDEKQDFVVEHFALALNPEGPGELRVQKLQIPALPAWTNLSAKTSYANKNLIISGLVLDSENQLRVLSVDASHVKAKTMALGLDSSLAGGTFTGSVDLTETGTSLGMKARLVADKISLDTLRGYMGRPPEFLSGDVDHLEVIWSGAVDSPRSWDGTVAAQISHLKKGEITIDRSVLRLTARGALLNIDSAEFVQGENAIRLTGNVTLPADIREFGRAPASLQISGALPNLPGLVGSLGVDFAGAANLEGRVDIVDAMLQAAIRVTAGPLTWTGGSVDGVTALITAAKKMPPADSEKVYYADLQTAVNLDVKNIRSGDYAIDSVSGKITTAEDVATIEPLVVARGQNTATIRGSYRLPVDFAKARLQPADISLAVQAPELAEFWVNDSPNKINGPLRVDGQIALRDGLADGAISLSSVNLRSRTLTIPELSAEIAIARNVVYLNDFTANLNEHDFIRATGIFATEKPFRYSGGLSVSVADLARLKPILASAGNKSELAGALAINWHGNGEMTDFKNTGDLKLRLEHGRYGDLGKLEANVDANYSPEALNVPIVFFSSDKVMIQAVMQAKDATLEISQMHIDQGQSKYASGYVSVPFVWANLGSDRPLFPTDGKVLVNFQTENLDIQKLAKDFGAAAPVAGVATVKLDAQGTLQDLHAAFDLQLTGLRSEKLTDFTPATFGLSARIEQNRLVIDGKLQQARIEPVQITANMPLEVARIVEQRKLDDNTPVSAKVRMPRSSVNFVRQFVPALERIDGNLALDVSLDGTIGKPVLSGAADMTINVARFSSASLPPLTNFNARLTFAGETLSFQQFKGDLAGGPFTLSGRITFPKLTEPAFDLQLKADAVLVARNDDLTARADADIRINGPLASATVTGDVAITNSQFFKNIDLIPIGLPGRPAPGPKPPAEAFDLSFPNPPLRDWKFDIAVKTKDPFMIRGNLANGGALVDMKLTGTGLQPKIDGSVRLQNVEATLPFSRLEISQGFLYFNPNDPLNPGLDLQGTSLVRDYTIHVYVYGTANAPEAVFTSEPPLPQEEIISLLATGTTREELLGGGNVLAGRAVLLLGQQLYRKIFKKGQPTKSNNVFDKLQVDVGNVDPRTGQQTATARYRVNEKVQLVGDIGVQGDFRGTVRYLIRFR